MAFNKKATHIEAYTRAGNWVLELSETVIGDFKYALTAVGMIGVYSILFLGSVSPLHSRCTVAILGLICISLACVAGFGICFRFKWYMTDLA